MNDIKKKSNGFDLIAYTLKSEGVEWLACFPNNPLIESCAKFGVRPVVFRQERGGIMAADGYSRLMAEKGKYGVFACQHGPGAENAFGGIAQAWADGVPILFLPEGQSIEKEDIYPNFTSTENYKNITKWSASVNSYHRLPSLMRRAFSALKNGRPGPVLLEIPRSLSEIEVKKEKGKILGMENFHSPKKYLAAPAKEDLRIAINKIINANNPVIWAGQGVLYSAATEKLKELAELLQIPVITTMPGKSAFDERHPLSLGSANRTAPKGVFKWLYESDVLFAIGASLTVTNYGIDIPKGKTIIHSTNNYEDIDKQYPTEIGLIGDARKTLCMMIDEVKSILGENGREKNTILENEISSVKAEWLSDFDKLLNSDDVPINPYRLINEINKNVDHENTIMTHDAGHPRDEIMPFYTATVPHSYIGWGKSTHLGYGIPLMIGAKIADPSKFCVNFMGDAAFGMSGLDLETANRCGAPITTILLNNKTMGGYNHGMPTAMEEFDAGNMTGDYAAIAEGLGGVGIKITEPNEIAKSLTEAKRVNFEEGKSVLLDVRTKQNDEMSIYSE